MQNKSLNEVDENKENTFKKKSYHTCFTLRSLRSYWAESERPAFNQISSMLRIRWWIHLYWILLTSFGERPCRLSLITACPVWNFIENVIQYLAPPQEFSSLAACMGKPVHTKQRRQTQTLRPSREFPLICSLVPLYVV